MGTALWIWVCCDKSLQAAYRARSGGLAAFRRVFGAHCILVDSHFGKMPYVIGKPSPGQAAHPAGIGLAG
jgi:hypothetical protein